MAKKKPKHHKGFSPQKRINQITPPQYKADNNVSDYVSLMNYATRHRSTDYSKYNIPMSTICDEITKVDAEKDMPAELLIKTQTDTSNLISFEIRQQLSEKLNSNEEQICQYLERVFSSYIRTHKNLNKSLNIYDKNSCVATADMIDMRDYVKPCEKSQGWLSRDILAEATEIINNNPDPCLLWSTSEYIHLKYDPAFEYLIHRVDFDQNTNTIRYEIAGYYNCRFIKNNVIKIPVFQTDLIARIIDIQDLRAEIDENRKEIESSDDVDTAGWAKLDVDAYEELTTRRNPPVENAIVFHTNGITSAPDLTKYCNQYTKKTVTNAKDQHIVLQLLRAAYAVCIDYDNSKNSSQDDDKYIEDAYNYLRQMVCQPLAAIVLVNKLIADKKLSQPINKKSQPAHTKVTFEPADISDTASPVRKTRHLGSNITIVSQTRPTVANRDKIIRYITMQWGRKEHLRHYKNGKIVKIKATTVHRKCDDKIARKSNQPVSTPVSYVIDND